MGEPACWMGAICLACGRMLDRPGDEAGPVCPHCGAELPPGETGPEEPAAWPDRAG